MTITWQQRLTSRYDSRLPLSREAKISVSA